MYSVKLYKDNNCVLDAPFDSKNQAIKYFNMKIDNLNGLYYDYPRFDRIEICDDMLVLFDYEV